MSIDVALAAVRLNRDALCEVAHELASDSVLLAFALPDCP